MRSSASGASRWARSCARTSSSAVRCNCLVRVFSTALRVPTSSPFTADAGLPQAAIRVFKGSERLNQRLIQALDPSVWSMTPPGRVRTIAPIFAHIHNVPCKWIRLNTPQFRAPAQLPRGQVTPQQAQAALAESAALCLDLLTVAPLPTGKVPVFGRDGWARPWPAGLEMLCYMLTHQLGFPLSSSSPVRCGTGRSWGWRLP